jgi:hypothetical protein
MANTYTLISSNTLSTSAASVTFSSIPATYTDLVLSVSSRNDDIGTLNGVIKVQYNGLSTSIYSFTELVGSGSAASSNRASSTTSVTDIYTAGGLNTASTFGSIEIYIPNYAGTAQKPMSAFGVSETNAAAVKMSAIAGLTNLTTAITSIVIGNNSAVNFVQYSSFYLYGIKNS